MACAGGIVAFAVACAGGADDAAGSYAPNAADGTAPGKGAGGGAMGGAAGASGTLPPEQEAEGSYLSPAATSRYVWVTNPETGRVAFVDAVTLSVTLLEAGNRPRLLAALPVADGDAAIVLNELSKDASLFRVNGGAVETVTVDLASGGNAWAVSATGRYAIAWTDAGKVQSPDPIDGYQDLTIVDAKKGAEHATPITVGYRPVSVSYDAAETRAFVVTQDGIAVVVLGDEPYVQKNVKIVGGGESANTRDVAITPDGARALVRRTGEKSISVVSLVDGATSELALPAPATDLDVSPDGTRALVVVRETGQIGIVDLANLGAPISLVTVGDKDNVIGSASLASKASLVFLYSNAVENPLLTLFDPGTSKASKILLRAPVSTVLPTTDAAFALVLHEKPPTDPVTKQPSSLYKAGFSVVPVAADLPPKIQGLAAKPVAAAIADDGSRLVVASGKKGDAAFAGHVVELPSLKIREIPLATPPVATGIVPLAKRAFFAQDYKDGRITFVDLVTGEVRTITGFELSSQVVYGGGQ